MLRRTAFVIMIALVAILITPASNTAAQATAPERRLKISPLRTELSITPGTAYMGTVRIENTGTTPLYVELSTEAFNVLGETYDYTFDPSAKATEWVHFSSKTLEIEPEAVVPIKYVINVPLGTEPGGVYLSLFAASIPLAGSSIESTDRVGSLLYITVPGDITKDGSLVAFSSPFLGTSAVNWSATVRNAGSVHFNANYTTRLKTLWGSPVSENAGDSLIMPRSVRLVQDSQPEPAIMGLYLLSYEVGLGDNGSAIGTRAFLYLPVGQVSALLALITACILFVSLGKDHRKQRKHRKQSKEKKMSD